MKKQKDWVKTLISFLILIIFLIGLMISIDMVQTTNDRIEVLLDSNKNVDTDILKIDKLNQNIINNNDNEKQSTSNNNININDNNNDFQIKTPTIKDININDNNKNLISEVSPEEDININDNILNDTIIDNDNNTNIDIDINDNIIDNNIIDNTEVNSNQNISNNDNQIIDNNTINNEETLNQNNNTNDNDNNDNYLLYGDYLYTSSEYISYTHEVINLINKERISIGLLPLNENNLTNMMASVRANESAANNWFEISGSKHIRPDGRNANSIMDDFNISGRFGEIMGRYQNTPAEIVEDWCDSSAHYGIIINKNYTQIGCGISKDKYGGLYWICILN